MPDPDRRALHVATEYGAPSETFVVGTIRDLDAAGWHAWLTALRCRPDAPFPPEDRRIIAPAPTLTRRLVDRARRASPHDRFAEAVCDRCAAIGASVLHAHFGWAGEFAAALAERMGLPLVTTFHGTDLTSYPSRSAYDRLFRRLDVAIVVSEFLRGKLEALGWTGRTEVVPTGIDLDQFSFRGATPVGDPPRLLFVGRQVAIKGLDVLLAAMPEILRHAPGATLAVIGDGPQHDALVRQAERLGVRPAVDFRGPRTHAQVAAAIADADLVVVPSRVMPDGQAEGLPVVVREALAVGTPVAATSSGGLPEALPPSHRGELAPPNDPGALARCVTGAIAARDSLPARAVEGRRWAEERFDSRAIASRIAGLYEEIASDHRLSLTHRGA